MFISHLEDCTVKWRVSFWVLAACVNGYFAHIQALTSLWFLSLLTPHALVDLLRRKEVAKEENGFLDGCWLHFSLLCKNSLSIPALSYQTEQPKKLACSQVCKEWASSWGQILGFWVWKVKILRCTLMPELWSRYSPLTSQVRMRNTTRWLPQRHKVSRTWTASKKPSHPLVHLLDHHRSLHNQPTVPTGLWQLPPSCTSVCAYTPTCKTLPSIPFSSRRH